VESIAWLSARSTGLFTMFYLSALLAYWRYLQHGYKFRYIGFAFLLFLLALFSKSMAATLPMVLFVMDAWHRRRFDKAVILEKVPFFALSIVFGLISIRAAASFGHIEVLEAGYTIFDRLFLLSYGGAFYLVKLFFPLNLSAIYAYPDKTGGWLPFQYYLSFVFLLLIAYGIYRLRTYRRETFLGFAFFILAISMVLPLFWSRLFIVAERYVYLPYIGLFVVAGVWLNALLEGDIKVPSATRNWILGISASWILIFGISAFVRTQVWQSTRILMEDVIDKKRSPADQAFGWFFLGNASDREGNIQQAIRDYSRALDHNPKHIQALNNRGIMKGNTGDFNGGLMDFTAAIRFKPDYAESYYNRGIVRYQTGQAAEACKDWQQAAKLGFSQAEAVMQEYCK
jgi:tetratricopeptide (TPR) repeat protein